MTDLPYPYLDQTEFPAIPAALVAALQGNFDQLANAQIDTGGRQIKLRFGSSTVVFSAAALSANTAVAHGMGSTPVAVGAIASAGGVSGSVNLSTNGIDATNINFVGRTTDDAAITTTVTFYWIAIG